jgi:cobalt-zinc-cadmium efflux system membrane fusion protein
VRAQEKVRNLDPRHLKLQGQRIGLVSPIDGVVTERTVTLAQEVNPSLPSPLFVVTDPRRLCLFIDVPENLLSRVKAGAAVNVESDAYPGAHFKAHIVRVGQVEDPNTRRVQARAELANPDGKLLPEMFVRASLLQGSGTSVRIPNAAIIDSGAYTFVFVENAPGQFQRRRVQLLTRGGEFSHVGDGLRGGERVVTSGALLLNAELGTRTAEKS